MSKIQIELEEKELRVVIMALAPDDFELEENRSAAFRALRKLMTAHEQYGRKALYIGEQ